MLITIIPMTNLSLRPSVISANKILLATVSTAALLSLSACQQPISDYTTLSGETMGTSYHISYQLPKDANQADIQAAIDERLEQINDSMSTYQDDSTISKFNRLAADTPITIDADFSHVLAVSRQVYQQSAGAFDPTVMPLIEIWGFGSTMTVERLQSPPSPAEIAQAKALVDFKSVVQEGDSLYKTKDGVGLDFSAVAKGYGVDVIAEVLKDNYQIGNYMVEIGGEVASSGVNSQQQPWQIAIDAPIEGSTVTERQTIAAIRQPLNNGNKMHLATSGNYRNSVIFDGKRYSHTIDPTTGEPIVAGAPSVTVAAESVALADAWATALTAMPYQQALATAEAQNIAAMFVILVKQDSTKADTLEDWQIVETLAMKKLRADKAS